MLRFLKNESKSKRALIMTIGFWIAIALFNIIKHAIITYYGEQVLRYIITIICFIGMTYVGFWIFLHSKE